MRQWASSHKRLDKALSSARLLSQPRKCQAGIHRRGAEKKRTDSIYRANRKWEKTKKKQKREIEFWPRLEKSFGRLLKNDTLFSFGSFQKVLYWRGIKTHLLPKQTQYADSRDEAVIMSVCLSYYSPYLFSILQVSSFLIIHLLFLNFLFFSSSPSSILVFLSLIISFLFLFLLIYMLLHCLHPPPSSSHQLLETGQRTERSLKSAGYS